jgi:hypothetical protein
MTKLHAATAVLLAVATAQSAVAQPSSLWNHNGSTMSLTANGDNRTFVYEYPRPGMAGVGVAPGTVLFDGYRDYDHYVGTARLFPPGCETVSYSVAGPVSSNDLQVTLYGYAPVIDRNCRQIGTRLDTLVFTHMRTLR